MDENDGAAAALAVEQAVVGALSSRARTRASGVPMAGGGSSVPHICNWRRGSILDNCRRRWRRDWVGSAALSL